MAGLALQLVLASTLASQNFAPGFEQVPFAYVDLADQLVQGLQFVCDACLDVAPMLSKLFVLAVVIRRVL